MFYERFTPITSKQKLTIISLPSVVPITYVDCSVVKMLLVLSAGEEGVATGVLVESITDITGVDCSVVKAKIVSALLLLSIMTNLHAHLT